MNGIQITSTTNALSAEFGDYSQDKGSWLKTALKRIWLDTEEQVVSVTLETNERFDLVTEHRDGAYQVDSVDGQTPSDLADLYAKMKALQG